MLRWCKKIHFDCFPSSSKLSILASLNPKSEKKKPGLSECKSVTTQQMKRLILIKFSMVVYLPNISRLIILFFEIFTFE